MSPRPVYLTSDVHLGAVPEATVRAFHRWLDHVGQEAGRLVINGDLFDFWFEYRTGVTRGHEKTLARLKALIDAGLQVDLFGGNHDWWVGRYLTEEIGLDYHPDPRFMDLAGLRTLVAHGDGLGTGDWGYKALRGVIRSWPAVAAFRLLTPELGERFGNVVSRTEDRGKAHRGPNPKRVEGLRTWAAQRMEGDPALRLVVIGHTHAPSLEELHPGRWLLNAGDWVYNRTYATISADGPTLHSWPED